MFLGAAFMTMLTATGVAKMNSYPRLGPAERRERILIVAPHVDDEAISAGGYAMDAIANGAEVYVVYLTAGDCSKVAARLLNRRIAPTPASYLNVGRARIAEARQAMEMIGVPETHYFMLGYPDRGLQSMLANRNAVVRSRGTGRSAVPYEEALSPGAPYSFDNVMRDLQHVVDVADPTIVIAPVAFDRHPDHRAAAELTDLALAGLHSCPQRYGYLVHTQMVPTALVSTPHRALLPPARMQQFSWTTYGLTRRVQQMKTNLLMTYKSQRPYVFILRNAFVRQNELFYVYPQAAATSIRPVRAAAAAR
jgi:LmbE family N-acetylglucosaminyl deacetylase